MKRPPDFYSLKKPGNLFIYTQRTKVVVETLREEGVFPLRDKKILDVGCGNGVWLADLEKWGAGQENLCGVDIREDAVKEARMRFPSADLRITDAQHVPWPDGVFDIVVQSAVFTSILDDSLKKKIAREMARVLKEDGLVLWYDFMYNNPANPNVRGIKAREVKQLFPGSGIKLKKITLAPPIARLLAPRLRPACVFLEKLKFLNTHYLAVIKK